MKPSITKRQMNMLLRFLRHKTSGIIKQGVQMHSLLRQLFRQLNLSLTGCSSAEPGSVSVHYKIQTLLLHLQTAKFSSHFHIDKMDNKVYRCSRDTSKPLNSWDSFYDMLSSEVKRLDALQRELKA